MSEPRAESPDDLTAEDERLLDQAWKTVSEWSPAKAGGARASEPVVLNRGPRR